MRPADINPYVRLSMRSVLPNQPGIRTRVIYDYELLHLERGTFNLIYGGTSYRITSGDTVLICPGVPHAFEIVSPTISQPHVHFDLTYRPESPEIPISFKNTDQMSERERSYIAENVLLPHLSSPIVTVKSRERFLETFYRLVDLREGDEPLYAKGLLCELLAMIIAENCPTLFAPSEGYSLARAMRDLIDAGLGHRMSLDDFALRFSYNKFYLSRIFRETYGTSLIEYRNLHRMKEARRMLKEASVSRVAEELGYGSIYSFSRAYKAHYGCAPTKAREP